MASPPQRCQKTTHLLDRLLFDLSTCQPCSDDQPCSSCSTMPARLQELFALCLQHAKATPQAVLHVYNDDIRRHLLKLCDELLKHKHRQTALVVASEGFYK